MSAIRHVWSVKDLAGDWIMAGPALDPDHALTTAVIISLFTDRLAREDDRLPDDSGDRRGWWGDTDAPQGPIGSRLWLLGREKQTEETRRRAEEYVREALAWMIEDGVAQRIDLTTEWRGLGVLAIGGVIYRRDGGPFEFRFDYAWREVAA